MEGWDGIEDLKAQCELAGSWLSVMKSPGLCLDYCSLGSGGGSEVYFISLMRADGGG